MIDNKMWYAGNLRLLEDKGIAYDKKSIEKLTSEGKTPIFLADEKKIRAIFGIADSIKENAKQAIRELHELGIKSVMLTGDNKQTAEYIAGLVGIDEVKAEVLPHEKADVIRSIQQE